jgi:hypothetical protein
MQIAMKIGTCLAILMLSLTAAMAQRTGMSERELGLIGEFERKAQDYVKMRNDVTRTITKVPDNATAEQIEAYKKSLQQGLRAARRNADQGDFFDRRMYSMIRRVVLGEFKTFKSSDLRREVLTAANKGVRLRVNAIYPETEELVMMPPSLLLALPQLPPELRFRFVGRSLILMDKDAALILDHMPNALP